MPGKNSLQGASLLQVYTGWIYEGPWMIRRILEGILAKLEAQGVDNITDLIGLDIHKP